MYNDNKKNPYYECQRCPERGDQTYYCELDNDPNYPCDRAIRFEEGYSAAETDLGWHEGKPKDIKLGNKIVCLVGDSPKYRVLTYVDLDLWEDEDGIEFPNPRIKYWMPIPKLN